MPLLDDLRVPVRPAELSRRRFLGWVVGGSFAVAAAGTAVAAVEYLSPNVLFEAATRFPLGAPSDFAEGAVTFFPQHQLYLVRSAGTAYAMSAVCTHLGCMTRWDAQAGRILCPCHGSQFSPEGRVLGGPAPRPLPRFALVLERGRLVVDTRKPASPDERLRL